MPEHEAWRLRPKVQPGQKYKDSLGVVVEIRRIIEVDPPDADDCPTCCNCGDDFEYPERWYDNDRFMYLCRQCAEAVTGGQLEEI